MKKLYTEPTIVVIELGDVDDVCMVQSTGSLEAGGSGNGIPAEAPSRRSSSWDDYERY